MSLLASAAIGWRAQLLSAGRLTFCIFNTSPHVCLVVVLVFIQAYVAFLLASAVFGWQAQLPSAGGLNICIIIYSLRIWFALRFYRHVDDQLLETMLAPGLKPYGERSQRSSKGITNFRGNCIEGLLGYIAKFIE